jgi:hypothetical protein
MATSETRKLAQDFLKDEAEIIRKYGHSPKMSGQKFQRVVNATKRTFDNLKTATRVSSTRDL